MSKPKLRINEGSSFGSETLWILVLSLFSEETQPKVHHGLFALGALMLALARTHTFAPVIELEPCPEEHVRGHGRGGFAPCPEPLPHDGVLRPEVSQRALELLQAL